MGIFGIVGASLCCYGLIGLARGELPERPPSAAEGTPRRLNAKEHPLRFHLRASAYVLVGLLVLVLALT